MTLAVFHEIVYSFIAHTPEGLLRRPKKVLNLNLYSFAEENAVENASLSPLGTRRPN